MIIELPDNNAISASAIVAVRTAKRDNTCNMDIKPRVIVDFVTGDHGNSIIAYFDDDSARDKFAVEITAQWKAYRDALPSGSNASVQATASE